MIKDLLIGKTSIERAEIKSKEISKLGIAGEYTSGDLKIEIQSLSKIWGGIEVLVRAWKNEKQLGFEGGVEIERIRVFNPPILVPDPLGDIIAEHTDPEGNLHIKRFKEDLLRAVQEDLAHTIRLVAKEGISITPGKVGSTVSTFFPDASVESTSVDGWVTDRKSVV